MTGPSVLDGALAAIMLCTATYHGARLLPHADRHSQSSRLSTNRLSTNRLSTNRLGTSRLGTNWLGTNQRTINLTHLVMGIAMALMLVGSIPPAATLALLVTFTIAGLWFGLESLLLLGSGAGWKMMHRFQHCAMSAGMVLMLAGHDRPLAANHAIAGMTMAAPDASRISTLTLSMVALLLLLSVWNFDQLGQAHGVGPGSRSGAGSVVYIGVPTAGISCRLSLCWLSMCLVMSYLLVAMA